MSNHILIIGIQQIFLIFRQEAYFIPEMDGDDNPGLSASPVIDILYIHFHHASQFMINLHLQILISSYAHQLDLLLRQAIEFCRSAGRSACLWPRCGEHSFADPARWQY